MLHKLAHLCMLTLIWYFHFLTYSQGSGGGPSEDNATGLLVRSTSSNWSPGSVLAVDAGSHLASITRILSNHFPLYAQAPQPPANDQPSENGSSDRSCSPEIPTTVLTAGPFAGVAFPSASARANALHVVKEHVATYLITHPHLDHLSAFAINTAAFHNTSRPKKLAALPFTVQAIKQHIFNDVIWPNLTDEDSGVGFVTFQRLTEGGNLALGEGDSRGYIEVCNGLATKGFRVSHGTCASKPPVNIALSEPGRRGSVPQIPETPFHSHAPPSNGQMRTSHTTESLTRRASAYTNSQPPTPTIYAQQNAHLPEATSCVVDSSAFFIRADATGREVLIWGDVEPDSLSMIPRNHIIWAEAATKLILGHLGGVFIECSYKESQPDSVLFGHLAPRHIIAELLVLADLVVEKRSEAAMANSTGSLSNKRKRISGFGNFPVALDDSPTAVGKRRSNARPLGHTGAQVAGHVAGQDRLVEDKETTPSPMQPDHFVHSDAPLSPPIPSRPHKSELAVTGGIGPLQGLRVVIIHVKDNMQDGPPVGEVILEELLAHEVQLQSHGHGLGCDFEISKAGESYWF
jgi:cAMP phosphodiesterase